MPIFLDSGKIKEVEKYMRMGIIRGVTTNPTILLKDGVKGGIEGVKERSIEIAKLIAPYPLSVEVSIMILKECLSRQESLHNGPKILWSKSPYMGLTGN